MVLALSLFSHVCLSEETQVKLYRPFNPSHGQADVVVNQTMKGLCWEQSHADKREGAWRCMVGSVVLDPCFVKSYGEKKQAICPQSPWNGKAIKVMVEQDLDDSSHEEMDMSKNYPWALELTDGARCQKIADSNQYFDGLPIHYLCDNDSVLFGRIQRCKAQWSMLQKSNSGVVTALIDKAWF